MNATIAESAFSEDERSAPSEHEYDSDDWDNDERFGRIFMHMARKRSEQPFQRWGFVLYRTVYAPESYQGLWAQALQTIRDRVRASFQEERLKDLHKLQETMGTTSPTEALRRAGIHPNRLDPGIEHEAIESFHLEVIEDPENLNNASIGDVRDLFRKMAFGKSNNGLQTGICRDHCLMINEQSMWSLVLDSAASSLVIPEDVPKDMRENIKAWREGYLTGIDACYPFAFSYPPYCLDLLGYTGVRVGSLSYFYLEVLDPEVGRLEECPFIYYHGEIPMRSHHQTYPNMLPTAGLETTFKIQGCHSSVEEQKQEWDDLHAWLAARGEESPYQEIKTKLDPKHPGYLSFMSAEYKYGINFAFIKDHRPDTEALLKKRPELAVGVHKVFLGRPY
ncbi:hypothetical protein BDZ85DRAFT_254386 [Elsinoe ampelina]|uniref:Uncharacterized protein n=1 Tax=Elsinoe ampelina TaxID=302913 RepID=A0A6A6GP64_9PEZI|nr:hypothetical protein BDZ85DRAFT_254386 [Elsinoe ampelina]